MNTFEMLKKAITAKKNRGSLTEKYIQDTQSKMDVFLMADRISEEQYTELNTMLEG